MEILEAVLMAIVLGAAPLVLQAVGHALVTLFAVVAVVDDPMTVSVLDQLFARRWCSRRAVGPGRLPADGVHVALASRCSFAVAVRATSETQRGNSNTKYTVYTVGRPAADAIRDAVGGDPADVAVSYVYCPTPWRTIREKSTLPAPAVPYAWQVAAVATAVAAYRRDPRGVTMLVCGPPGTGKSTLALALAAELRRTLGVVPVVTVNADLTLAGHALRDMTEAATATVPVVLVLNEFDAACDFAESADRRADKKEGTALACSPTSLLGVLDRFAQTRFMVTIATTNRTLAEMRATPGLPGALGLPGGVPSWYERYTRPGRFNYYVTSSDQHIKSD